MPCTTGYDGADDLFEVEPNATAVIELTEDALGRVDKAMSTLDDSGWFSQVVSELERLHHEACVVAKPEPLATVVEVVGRG